MIPNNKTYNNFHIYTLHLLLLDLYFLCDYKVNGCISQYPNMNTYEFNDNIHNNLINYLRKSKPYFFSLILRLTY